MQHEITAPQRLLDENGNIKEPGFAKKLFWQYSREDIKAPKSALRNGIITISARRDYGLCLTISDAGFVSCLSVSVLEFGEKPMQMNDSEIGLLPLGKLNLPATSERGNTCAKVGTADMKFENDGNTRRLHGTYDNFCNSKKCLVFDVTLSDMPEESMVIATPFDKDKHFYYNQKINCMRAEGFFEFDGKRYEFNAENGALGTLDWGRGVWTYDNTWYWGSGQMLLRTAAASDSTSATASANTAAASENMLFLQRQIA
jgi:hypothetical protein